MNFASTIYKRSLSSGKVQRRAWRKLRKLSTRLFSDPDCEMEIHGQRLTIPMSHPLPEYMSNFPLYDRLPSRISKFVHRSSNLNCIDVGANVGDTIAAFYQQETDVFLAVEPNPSFSKYLHANWGSNPNVTVVEEICSSVSETAMCKIDEKNGTASIAASDDGTAMTRRTLDEMVADNQTASQCNVLKVDTDGHDFEVLAGAKNLIATNQPTVLFECEMFSNQHVHDCFAIMKFFAASGYDQYMLYDNFGYLMGRYPLDDLNALQNLFFYELTSPFHYFDILVMKPNEIREFYECESEFFSALAPDNRRDTAREVASFVKSTAAIKRAA